ncbi:hypothetical protein DIPPA_18636 [Diplonema papillatum]|nr:hypothetical protein DIPPA_18636 [Diplonema papillatum]
MPGSMIYFPHVQAVFFGCVAGSVMGWKAPIWVSVPLFCVGLRLGKHTIARGEAVTVADRSAALYFSFAVSLLASSTIVFVSLATAHVASAILAFVRTVAEKRLRSDSCPT